MSDENNINNLIQDLTQLVQTSDDRIAFWASAALNHLTRLRSLTSQLGFVHWNFQQAHLFRDDPAVKAVFESGLEALQKVADLLEDKSIRLHADEESTGAASRIYHTVRSDPTVNPPGYRIET